MWENLIGIGFSIAPCSDRLIIYLRMRTGPKSAILNKKVAILAKIQKLAPLLLGALST